MKNGEWAEKARPIIENEKQDTFCFRLLDFDVHASLSSTKHDVLSFLIL